MMPKFQYAMLTFSIRLTSVLGHHTEGCTTIVQRAWTVGS